LIKHTKHNPASELYSSIQCKERGREGERAQYPTLLTTTTTTISLRQRLD
jgi:hypothetical protein